MNQEVKITLPKLGESIVSATIVQWFKKVGDAVRMDEPLLEVSTDKVNSEIPSPVSGIVKEILAESEEELQVGEPLAVITLEESSAPSLAQTTPAAPVAEAAPSASSQSDFYSPAVLRLAREFKISFEELEKILGTGEAGRITKKDLESYVEAKRNNRTCTFAAPTTSTKEEERIKMSGLRKAIADNMVKSFYAAPHASLITEIDLTRIVHYIEKEKEAFFVKNKAKLTLTCFIAKALAEALQQFPHLNASLEGDTIVVKRYVNLGIAVSVEGGLVVPVIRQCQNLSIEEIAQAIQDLSSRAREGKLRPQDVQEGTITLTNFGISGVLIGVPIIRYPEVAIIGVGAAHKQVVPLQENSFGVRTMAHFSLTFDNRVLDGMYGCAFLKALKQCLENNL